jgi:hypothetical protein
MAANTPSRSWRTNEQVTAVTFRAVLEDRRTNTPFNDAWFDKLAKIVSQRYKAVLGLIVATVIPTGYLVLYLSGAKADINFFGLRLSDKDLLFQLALLATCLFGVYAARLNILAAQSQQLMEVWSEAKWGKKLSTLHMFAFEPPLYRPPVFAEATHDGYERTSMAKLMDGTAQGSFWVIGIAIALGVFAVQVWAVSWASLEWYYVFIGKIEICPDTIDARTFGKSCAPRVYGVILVFALVMTVANALIYLLYGVPRPFRRS